MYDTLDFVVRHITTGDEEETRLLEEPLTWQVDVKQDMIRRGASMKEVHKFARLFNKYVSGNAEDWEVGDKIVEALLPYVSQPDLYKSNYSKWENDLYREGG